MNKMRKEKNLCFVINLTIKILFQVFLYNINKLYNIQLYNYIITIV